MITYFRIQTVWYCTKTSRCRSDGFLNNTKLAVQVDKIRENSIEKSTEAQAYLFEMLFSEAYRTGRAIKILL